MRTDTAQPIRLKDYRPPNWLVETVSLDFSLHPDANEGSRDARAQAQPGGGRRPAGARRRRAHAHRAQARWNRTAAGKLCGDARQSDHPAGAERPVHAGDRDAGRSDRQHPAIRPVPVERHFLHAMRSRGLPPHHLFPGPARRDGGLHHARRSRQRRSARAAVERQSDRERRPAGRPAFRGLARSASQAVLSLRAGRRKSRRDRGSLRHDVGTQRHAAHLCRARQREPLRLRHGFAQALDALGRSKRSGANTISTFS